MNNNVTNLAVMDRVPGGEAINKIRGLALHTYNLLLKLRNISRTVFYMLLNN